MGGRHRNNVHSPIVSFSPITSNVTKVYSFEVEILPKGEAAVGAPFRLRVLVNVLPELINGSDLKREVVSSIISLCPSVLFFIGCPLLLSFV